MKPQRGAVQLHLSVSSAWGGKGWEWDTYADSVYADMEPSLTLHEWSSCLCVKLPPPPRRMDHDLGEGGRTAYRVARAEWYWKRTGHRLTGTTAEQEEQFDNACRILSCALGEHPAVTTHVGIAYE